MLSRLSRQCRRPLRNGLYSQCFRYTNKGETETETEAERDGGGERGDETHWMSKNFPSAEEWLLKQSEEWWHKGLSAICDNHHKLGLYREEILEGVSWSYAQLYESHKHRITDSRSKTHLQQALLALATYRNVLPWLQSDVEQASSLVEKLQGKESQSVLNPLQRMAFWLSRDKFAMVANRLKLLEMDYGGAFETDFKEGEAESKLSVRSCFYHRLFSAEGAPELTQSCCCSVDTIWFQGIENQTRDEVTFERTSSISQGDKTCQLIVRNK
jgi:hypothetical protein